MKLFFFTLALLFTAHLALAQDEYVTLSSDEANDGTIQSLKYFGWKFVIEKGIHQSTKFPLENGDWSILSTESTERRTTDEVTYYRFTVQLGLYYGTEMTIRARYVVSHRPSNGRFLISSWTYTKIQNANTGQEEETVTGGTDVLDIRPLNSGSSDLNSLLDYAITATVEDAVEQGALPDASYSLKYVYSAEDFETSVPPEYHFLVSLVNDDGNYYRVKIEIVDNSVLGNSEEYPQDEPIYKINPVYEPISTFA